MKHSIEVLISEKEIQQRIYTLAEQITDFYQDSSDLVMVGLLRGSFIFIADLARSIQCPLSLDFMTVSSYGQSMHSGDVTILKDLEDDIKGRDVLLVEDIIDTGKTLHSVREILARRKPKSIRICTLLDKPARREIDIPVDWVGFEIPDEFVVGLGIDYAQKYRNLPYIGKVVQA
ncbi:MAG: hypoxanthine phosphoribosyltransferase [Vibrionaceae bacterium]